MLQDRFKSLSEFDLTDEEVQGLVDYLIKSRLRDSDGLSLYDHTAVNIVLYAEFWQNGGCLSFGLICQSYNGDFLTGCELNLKLSHWSGSS